jgi:plastocyanin
VTRHIVVAVILGVTGIAACRPHRGPVRHDVVMQELRFQPVDLVVGTGDTISWVNRDIVPHTTAAQDSTWNSSNVPAESSFVLVAERPGSYSYACAYHPAMVARLVVR